MPKQKIGPLTNGIIGLAIGDALGVPVEFKPRSYLKANPVQEMLAYGTHQQAKGTWSDDSSLAFCLADSLRYSYDLIDIAKKMVAWKYDNLWSPHGKLFDIGMTTSRSLEHLRALLKHPELDLLKNIKYGADENTNGNGSLMRILPLYAYIKNKSIEEQFDIIWDVSSLTHGHIRAALACLIYLTMIDYLIRGKDKFEAYALTQKKIILFFKSKDIASTERAIFSRIISNNIHLLPEDKIHSAGYVMHSLEASFWVLLKNEDFKSTVLHAVNLGEDTDTTGAIAGGLAGVYYGNEAFPKDWIYNLARIDEILLLCHDLQAKYA